MTFDASMVRINWLEDYVGTQRAASTSILINMPWECQGAVSCTDLGIHGLNQISQYHHTLSWYGWSIDSYGNLPTHQMGQLTYFANLNLCYATSGGSLLLPAANHQDHKQWLRLLPGRWQRNPQYRRYNFPTYRIRSTRSKADNNLSENASIISS